MKQDFFKYLPSQITINILSRLCIKTIARSKCVSKSWLNLLESDAFIESHMVKSIPCLAVLTLDSIEDSSSFTIFQLEDGPDLESHELHYNHLLRFDFPHSTELRGSANGLVFLWTGGKQEIGFICNPITRDYIEIHLPRELIREHPRVLNYPEIIEENVYSYPHSVTYGFGVSTAGQYKFVRIFHDNIIVHGGPPRRRIIPESECHVYTLGTGSWRRVSPGALFEHSCRSSCVFLNGNLHWVVSDCNEKQWISCFDLETEAFRHFSTPPIFQEDLLVSGLSVLEDCLCLCDHSYESETVVWLMKEYGVEESWSKVYVFNMDPELDIEGFELVYPIKIFEDGDVLMLQEDRRLICYSSKTGGTREFGLFSTDRGVNSTLLTPSFVSLKRFGNENVVSF